MDEIINLRDQIDQIDEKVIDLVAERIALAKKVGIIKKQNGIEVVDKQREEEILKNLTTKTNEKGLDPEVVKKIWEVLIKASYEVEG